MRKVHAKIRKNQKSVLSKPPKNRQRLLALAAARGSPHGTGRSGAPLANDCKGLSCGKGLRFWASHFTLETPNRNTYALFYFTSSRRGLEKMLESQWKEDPDAGAGHRADQNFTLFPPGILANYSARVEAYLAAAASRTNEDLLEFGLREGFRSTHTNDVLRTLTAAGRLRAWEPECPPLRKNSFYLNDPERNIRFALIS